jgi:hypothetical protein
MKHFLLIMVAIFAISCEPVYKAENTEQIVKQHKTIAILPTNALIEIKKSVEADKVKAQEKLESVKLQAGLYDRFQERIKLKKLNIYVLPNDSTNKILKNNNIVISQTPYKKIAEVLGVDAIVVSKISMAKPLTNAEAFFSNLLAGPAFNSKVTTADISIIDKASGRMFWNYTWENGGTFASADALTKSLMKSAVIRFPYNPETK